MGPLRVYPYTYTYHSPLLVDASERLFDLLGQCIELALDLLLARRVGVFELHLRQLVDNVGRGVSDLLPSALVYDNGNLEADLGKRHVARLDDPGAGIVVVDKVSEHAHRLVEGAHSVVLRDTVLLQEVVLS